MTYATSSKQILKAINHPLVSLTRVPGDGYWYFTYDDGDKLYETESVYTVRLNDMTVDQWAAYARDLIKRVEN